MPDILIRNARMVDHETIFEADIAISNGVIETISISPMAKVGDRVINAGGKLVIPGVIDPHSHLGQNFGIESEVRTETRSAVTGGVTTFMTLLREYLIGGPYLENYKRVESAVETNAVCDMAFHIGIQESRHLSEMPTYLSNFGITSFKFRMVWLGDQRKKSGPNPVDDGRILEGMKLVQRFGDPAIAMVHCENPDIIAIAQESVEQQGRKELAAYTDSRPEIAEFNAMAQMINLAKYVGSNLYIPHVTIGKGVELIRESMKEGVMVTGETCPHYLTHTKDCSKGSLATVDPPLREKQDIARLWDGIKEGVIKCIGTDHAPHLKKFKRDVFGDTRGFPGTGTLLPVLLSEGFHKSRISLNEVVSVSSRNAAKVFGMYPKKGCIRVGSDADLTIVDLEKEVEVNPDLLNSASDFTLFDGWKLKGWPVMTIVRGEVVMEDGQVVAKPGVGKVVKRTLSNPRDLLGAA